GTIPMVATELRMRRGGSGRSRRETRNPTAPASMPPTRKKKTPKYIGSQITLARIQSSGRLKTVLARIAPNNGDDRFESDCEEGGDETACVSDIRPKATTLVPAVQPASSTDLVGRIGKLCLRLRAEAPADFGHGLDDPAGLAA